MTPLELLEQMAEAASLRYGSDRQWAIASGLPPETLSRLQKRGSCDLRTLDALAKAVGYKLIAVPD